jgi:hypothetical protein
MTSTDAERTIVYLSNELRKATDTVLQQHHLMTVMREQLRKADEQVERLKKEAAAAQQ